MRSHRACGSPTLTRFNGTSAPCEVSTCWRLVGVLTLCGCSELTKKELTCKSTFYANKDVLHRAARHRRVQPAAAVSNPRAHAAGRSAWHD